MDHLLAKMHDDLMAKRLGTSSYTRSAAPPAPVSPLADLLRAIDQVTPQARIEKWCVLDMVPSRWEPITGWLRDDAWAKRMAALPPVKLYRVVDKHSRKAQEVILTPDGNVLLRTDGRSWVDPVLPPFRLIF